MSDLATIRIPVDSSDMVKAVREAKNLESGVKMLFGALTSGAISVEQYNKGLLNLKRKYEELFTSSQQATARVRGYSAALQENSEEARRNADAQDKLTLATKRAETAFALAEQKAKEQLQSQRNRAEFAWAMAMQREKEAQAEMRAAEKIVAAQKKIELSAQRTSTAFTKQAYVAQESQKANRRFEVGVQQAGYQVGDFFVQVASGTNPMVAFTQQATQLAGFFAGPWGAIIGAGLSIFGAVAIAMSVASDKTTELNFNFAKFGQDMKVAIEPIMPLLRAIGEAFKFLGNLAVDSINVILNSFRILGAAVGAVPSAFDSLVTLVDAQMFRLELVVKGYVSIIKAALQDMFDLMSGSTAMINNNMGQPVSLADSYRQEATYYSGAASAEVSHIANLPGPGDVIGNAVAGVQPIDIRSYFSRTPVPGKGGGSKEDTLKNLLMEQNRRKELLDLYGKEKALKEEIFKVTDQLGDAASKLSADQIKNLAEINLALSEQEDLQKNLLDGYQQISDTISSSMENAFVSMVNGTMSVKDAFKSMAYDIIKELYRVLVVQRMVGSFNMTTGKGSGLVGSLGNFFTGGGTAMPSFLGGRASGGSMMGGNAYLVGEHGPELVVPRHSGTVVNANQTANALGGDSGGFTQNLTISVTGSDASMVRAEVAKMIPQITNATKAAVIDAKQRGGQMAAAFR